MSDIYFSNYQLEENTDYFLYIGELKNYGLNIFLAEALSRISGRKFEFISIVPDIFEQYNYKNLIAINPLRKNQSNEYGPNFFCRISAKKFMTCVSENHQIKDLIHKLLLRQDNLFIYMYESKPEMTLDAIEGVSILGPDSKIAFKLNSKIYQYKNLKEFIPVVEFDILNGLNELIKTTDKLWLTWNEGIFVSQEYSAAGVNSIIAHSTRDIINKFNAEDDKDETYLISRYIPHNYDPTVLGVVANENDVYIAGIADQCIEKGTRFTGSIFPSLMGKEIVSKLKENTRVVGKWLAKEGYRGLFGCDFIVDLNGSVMFIEINARKQGTTLEFCCTLENSLPKGSPMLPELEYYAVTKNRFPEGTVEMEKNPKNLHWGTYNYKLKNTVRTNGYIPQSSQEREAFRKVANSNLKKDFLILEHTGSDFIVAEGSFLGRIVSLGRDHSSVRQGISQGQKTIELTIDENVTSKEK